MNRVLATFDGISGLGDDGSSRLSSLCADLLKEQKASWPDLGDAHGSLEKVRERHLSCRNFSVRLLWNPGRITSSTAQVSKEEIAGRPCFLCDENLPEPQKAILYRDEYAILCNPMPILPRHLTITHRQHRPQALVAHVDAFLHLMTDFGDQWTILYNGPRCGASAPDHLHFQALPSGQTPIEKEIMEQGRLVPIGSDRYVSRYLVKDSGRWVVLLEGRDPGALTEALAAFIETLKEPSSHDPEPMINAMGLYEAGRFRVLIFPRKKHRPDAFFAEGDDRILVSPAVLEMAGIIVTPLEKDFLRLDAATIEAIYEEVSLAPGSDRIVLI